MTETIEHTPMEKYQKACWDEIILADIFYKASHHSGTQFKYVLETVRLIWQDKSPMALEEELLKRAREKLRQKFAYVEIIAYALESLIKVLLNPENNPLNYSGNYEIVFGLCQVLTREEMVRILRLEMTKTIE